MKRNFRDVISLIILLYFISAAFTYCTAQRIYEDRYRRPDNIRVYVTKYQSQADVIVYKERYPSAVGTDGTRWYAWRFPDTRTQARIVYVTEYSQADLVVFFTKYRSSARWKRPHKKYLLVSTQ